jgi:hypothetical protein
MGRSSRNSEEKVSFFAFQDIITAVIGILVLIALILALQINPKRENEGESPGNNTAPVELIEGDNDGGGNATIVVVSEFNASEVIEEIAQLHQEISDEKREFLVERDEKNSEIEELLKELKRVNMELEIFKKKLGIVDSNESKDMNKALKSLQLILDLAKVQQKELDEKKKGLEDQVNARILRNITDMSELELQELDSQLNSQIEQLSNQVENEVRVIPRDNKVGEKPVLVVLGAGEFTVGKFNGQQRTVQVNKDTYYEKLVPILQSYDKKRDFFVYFFRPSAIGLVVGNVPKRGGGTITRDLFKLLCDQGAKNLTNLLGFKYGFEPIHEEAAVLFTDKTPDLFEDLFISP